MCHFLFFTVYFGLMLMFPLKDTVTICLSSNEIMFLSHIINYMQVEIELNQFYRSQKSKAHADCCLVVLLLVSSGGTFLALTKNRTV